MAVTSIDISRELLDEVKAATGLKTNREVVTYALERVMQFERQAATIQWMYENNPLADLNDPEIKAQARS